MTVQSFNINGKPAEAVYLGDIKLWPAGGVDPATALIRWGTADIGATYGPAVLMGHAAAGGTTTAIGATMADTPGAAVTEPTPGTYRFHIPAFTATGPNSAGMRIPVAHPLVPSDDRLYRWIADVVTFIRPTSAAAVHGNVAAVLGPIPLAVGDAKMSPGQTAVQVNATIAAGLKVSFIDAAWINKLGTDFQPMPGVFDPATKAYTETDVVVRNIRLVAQEIVAGP
jgi:hypothetical protein